MISDNVLERCYRHKHSWKKEDSLISSYLTDINDKICKQQINELITESINNYDQWLHMAIG